MIWVLTVMLWYEGEVTRFSQWQGNTFSSGEVCQEVVFKKKVELVDELLETFRDLDGMKLTGFQFFCENQIAPQSNVESKKWDEV